eukprot:2355291-Prymnesium_polylepis.1
MSTSWSLAGPGSGSYHLSGTCRGSDGPGSGPAAASSAAHVRGVVAVRSSLGCVAGLGGIILYLHERRRCAGGPLGGRPLGPQGAS